MKKKTIVCDLDGTLFNIDHRLHYLEVQRWEAFFAACKDDTPNQWCVDLVRAMVDFGHEIVFVSGRNSVTRDETEEQLYKLGFGKWPLYMRDKHDRQPDYILKAMLHAIHLHDRDILFVIEDRKQVAKMWRAKGLVVLQCAEGDF